MKWSLINTVLFLLLILNFSGRSNTESDKISITASSQTAVENFKKGRDLFEKLQGQESLPYLNKAIEQDGKFAMAYLFASFSQPTAQGFFEYLDKAVALKNEVSEGERLWIEGVKAASDGYPMKQRELYVKLVEKYPVDERAHNLLGNSYFGTQEWEKAIAEYERVIQINPEFSQSYNQLGYAYRFLNRYDDAEKAFREYIRLIPNSPNPYDSYAELLMKMGRYDESIENYRKALNINPNFVASHVGIATNLNFKQEYEKARNQLDKLFSIARSDGERRAAKFARTVSYVDEGKFEEALQELNWQYDLGKRTDDPANMAGDLIFMGNILFEQKKYDDAQDKYQNALQVIEESGLSPDVKENARRIFLYNTARVDIMRGDQKSAREKTLKFLKLAEEVQNTFQTWLAHELLGMIYMKEQDYDSAVKEFEMSNLQNPYNLYRLAGAWQAKGNNSKAKEYAVRAANHNTLNSIQYAFIRHKAMDLAKSL